MAGSCGSDPTAVDQKTEMSRNDSGALTDERGPKSVSELGQIIAPSAAESRRTPYKLTSRDEERALKSTMLRTRSRT